MKLAELLQDLISGMCGIVITTNCKQNIMAMSTPHTSILVVDNVV